VSSAERSRRRLAGGLILNYSLSLAEEVCPLTLLMIVSFDFAQNRLRNDQYGKDVANIDDFYLIVSGEVLEL